MYVAEYQRQDRMWTVGHYDPDGGWHAISDHGSAEEAAAEIHYLNGGTRPCEPAEPAEAAPCGLSCRHQWEPAPEPNGSPGWMCPRCGAAAIGREPPQRTPVTGAPPSPGRAVWLEDLRESGTACGAPCSRWRLWSSIGESQDAIIIALSGDCEYIDAIFTPDSASGATAASLPPSEGGPIP